MGTPYKMKGHSLPGPNQASPVKQNFEYSLAKLKNDKTSIGAKLKAKYGGAEQTTNKAGKKIGGEGTQQKRSKRISHHQKKLAENQWMKKNPRSGDSSKFIDASIKYHKRKSTE